MIAGLTARVFRLEGSPSISPPSPPEPVPIPAAVDRAAAPEQAAESILEPPARARADDWETIVGTSWLNRVGALVLVIGIALFLGYSLTQLEPAGKVAIGFAAGLSMLASGMAVERQERYRTLAPGLIAGGWAVAYFTGYAMHGIEAARVIASPAVGTAILLGISAAMILHALRYESEKATGLAYLFAFTSLNLTPLTSFSVIATAVLAASLLFLAQRLGWMKLAVAGALMTYLTFLLRYDVSIYGLAGVINGQATLWTYWLLFEGFDLFDIWRRGPRAEIQRSLFLLNAAGFIGASLLHHWNVSSTNWAPFFAISALAYLASSIVRARLVRGLAADDTAVWRGGYEGAAAAAAGLMAAALIQRYSGLQMALALLMEGELVVLAGLYLRNVWIQNIGAAVLFAAFVRLVAVNMPSQVETKIAGWSVHSWAPLALLMAGVFAGNRLLQLSGVLYGAGASVLIAALLEAEVERYWATAAWGLLAMLVLLAGIQWKKGDLRIQAYIAVLLTFLRAVAINVSAADTAAAIIPVAVAVGMFYGGQMILRNAALQGRESHSGNYLSVTSTSLLTLLLFDAVQGRLLTVALGFEGAALLVARSGCATWCRFPHRAPAG
jgi:hypothetical protein